MFQSASFFNGKRCLDLCLMQATKFLNHCVKGTYLPGTLAVWRIWITCLVRSHIFQLLLHANDFTIPNRFSTFLAKNSPHCKDIFEPLFDVIVGAVPHISTSPPSDGDISQRNVRNVQSTSYMFREASAFNSDLSSWELRLVALEANCPFVAAAFISLTLGVSRTRLGVLDKWIICSPVRTLYRWRCHKKMHVDSLFFSHCCNFLTFSPHLLRSIFVKPLLLLVKICALGEP